MDATSAAIPSCTRLHQTARRMSQSVHLLAEQVVARVAELSAITADALRSPTQSRSVGKARSAAAHLLRTDCGRTRRETARLLGGANRRSRISPPGPANRLQPAARSPN